MHAFGEHITEGDFNLPRLGCGMHTGQVLAGYVGTVLLVTHDRVFLDRFGATRTIEL